MWNYGRYHENVEDAFWGQRSKVYKDRLVQFAHSKVRKAAMARMVRLEKYLSRAEGFRSATDER